MPEARALSRAGFLALNADEEQPISAVVDAAAGFADFGAGNAYGHAITTTYGGDSGHSGSSNSSDLTVNLNATTTELVCDPSTTVFYYGTICTVTVTDTSLGTAIAPSDNVSFTTSGTGIFRTVTGYIHPVQSCALSGIGASASCQVEYLPEAIGSGIHILTGSYSGDATHTISSDTFEVTVTRRATLTTISCTPSNVDVGMVSTCTATAGDASSGRAIAPFGSVSFASNGAGTFNSTSCTLTGSPFGGSTSCSVDYTPTAVGTGTHTISANYGGDAGHTTSSDEFGLTVEEVPPTSLVLLSFDAFDADNYANGVGELDVLVNGRLVVNIPAGLLGLTGTGEYAPFDEVWTSFGPLDITNYVGQGTNTIVFRNPLTDHSSQIRNVEALQATTLFLNFTRRRTVNPDEPVNLTFSNPPLGLVYFTISPQTPLVKDRVTFTVTYVGGVGPFRCSFSFGDGTRRTSVSVTHSCSTSHAYSRSGTFTARVTVKDSNTGDLITGTILVPVQPQPRSSGEGPTWTGKLRQTNARSRSDAEAVFNY